METTTTTVPSLPEKDRALLREVFPSLTDSQLDDIAAQVGAGSGRDGNAVLECLQCILDNPRRYLVGIHAEDDNYDNDGDQGDHRRCHTESHHADDTDADGSSRRPPMPAAMTSTREQNEKMANSFRSKSEEEDGLEHVVLSAEQEERKEREFNDLFDTFADIFSGTQSGSVIFQGHFRGSKGRVTVSSQDDEVESKELEDAEDEDMDLVLARALQAMEDDAYRTMKKIEEEDEKLAKELARQENEGVGDNRIRDHASEDVGTLQKVSKKRMRLISTDESDVVGSMEEKEAPLERVIDSKLEDLEERDRRVAMDILKREMEQEHKQKRKLEEKDATLSLGSKKRQRTEMLVTNGEELTTDELIVKLLQEEEEEEYKRERERKTKEEEEKSRKLIEQLMRQEEQEHDEWVRGELAKIEENEKITLKKKKKDVSWPGFGFGWGDKERMQEKKTGYVLGDQDWKVSRFFCATGKTVLEEYLQSCARTRGSVTITNVMKYDLAERFERKWADFKGKYGPTSSQAQVTLGFHGTRGKFIPSITSRGLLVPGKATGVKHVTDSGWWGRGIYLSPDPCVAQGYASDGKLLVCSVLMGRIFHCKKRMDGKDCVKGYDSHTSPCGQELVLFDAAQVLPCYLITFAGAWS